MAVSCHVGPENKSGSLEEQPILLTAEPSLHPCSFFKKNTCNPCFKLENLNYFWMHMYYIRLFLDRRKHNI